MDTFIEHYVEYEMKNKMNIVNSLLLQYFDIKNTIGNYINTEATEDKALEKEQIIAILIKNLKTVSMRLQKFDSEHIIAELEATEDTINKIITRIKMNMITGFDYIGDEISIIAKRLYWDTMETFDNISNDFAYIKSLLMSCTPNRVDLHAEYDLHIDIKFIDQQIKHCVYNSDNFNGLLDYIFDKIKVIDSIDGNNKIHIWYEKWNKIRQLPTDRMEVIPLVMRDVTNRLEKIYYLVHGHYYTVVRSDNPSTKDCL